jgi:hypothetical protein
MQENKNINEAETLVLIAQSIMANQLAYDYNSLIKFTIYYKQGLRNRLNLVQDELKKAEIIEFDKIMDREEKETTNLYKIMDTMIKEITSLSIYDFENITHIVRAYKKDCKSIEGIVNKINKHK